MLFSFIAVMKRTEAISGIAVVGIAPSIVSVPDVGDRFTVNITITNVTNLFAYEIKVFYKSTQLEALWMSLPPDHFMKPLAGGSFYIVKNTTESPYNATHRFAWFCGSLLAPETARTGSGILFQVRFSAKAKGGPYPIAIEYPEFSYPAKLSTPSPPIPIPCTSTPSWITVGGKIPTTVYFDLTPNPAHVGETVTLKGVLIDEFSKPLSGKAVKLYARPLVGSWKYIKSLTTSSDGIFTWQAKIPGIPPAAYVFAAYYQGSESYERCYNFAILIVQ